MMHKITYNISSEAADLLAKDVLIDHYMYLKELLGETMLKADLKPHEKQDLSSYLADVNAFKQVLEYFGWSEHNI